MGELDSRWVRLPDPIDAALWERLRSRLGGGAGPGKPFSSAGIRIREHAGRIWVRTDPFTYLYVAQLLTADGMLRSDARRRLYEDFVELDVGGSVSRYIEANNIDTSLLSENGRMQLEVAAGVVDELELISDMANSHGLGAFRVGMRREGWFRLAFWELVGQLADGVAPDKVGFGESMANPSELLNGQPSLVVAPPVMATAQPPFMLLLTTAGTQLVFTAGSGGGFRRDTHLPAWPVGMSSTGLEGGRVPSVGSYSTDPTNHADLLLEDMTEAGNRTLGHITDPLAWSHDGVLDLDERNINWASLRFGLDAVRSVAGNYESPSSLWEAFRALGTLQGIWEGPTAGSVPLGWMFDPRAIAGIALPAITNFEHRRWCTHVADSLAKGMGALGSLDAGPRSDRPCEAAEALADIRNLVHGVGNQQRNRGRSDRLSLVRSIEENRSSLALLKDLAGVWWSAALCDPTTLLAPGFRPHQVLSAQSSGAVRA